MISKALNIKRKRQTYSGGDANVVILVLDLVRAVGLEVDLGADREDRGQIDEAARLSREDLELSDDISHCKGCWGVVRERYY